MSSLDSTNASSGLGLSSILTIIFVLCKLFGVIDWSWWWVFSPIWIPLTVILVGVLIWFIIMFIVEYLNNK